MARFLSRPEVLLLLVFSYFANGATVCRGTKSGFRLKGSVFKLEKLHDQFNIGGLKNIEGLSKTIFINNRNVTVDRIFKDKMFITETADFEFCRVLNQFHSVSFETSTIVESLPYLTRVSKRLKAGLAKAFQNPSSYCKPKRYGVNRKTRFKFNVRISVPPCTEEEVTPLVKMAENYEMNYRVLLKISGENRAGEKLRTKDVFKILEKSQIVFENGQGHGDNFTAVAETRAKLNVSFGLWTAVSKLEAPISTCKQ